MASTTQEVATGLVSLVKECKLTEASEKYYSPNIVSTEPYGEPATVKGIDAVHGKNEWWHSNYEMHGCDVEGPYVNGDTFAVKYGFDVTEKKTGKRNLLSELAVYTVADGKIVDEKFLVDGNMNKPAS
ncbi:MAG TPA: nuclear transport factor 2 family protein [Capsulimonadaceae bacterium]|jgi:hypothetical protein